MFIRRTIDGKSEQVDRGPMDEYLYTEVILHSKKCLHVIPEFNEALSFRGQSDDSWTLKTTLERFTTEGQKKTISSSIIEQKILTEFKSNIKNYLQEVGHIPDGEDVKEWLSLIQHYGGPTRLLDLTDHFNTALFFAISNNYKTNAAIFCFRKVDINTAGFDINDYISKDLLGPGATLPPPVDKTKKIQLYKPKFNNKRIQAQGGHFILHTNPETSFENNLFSHFNTTPDIKKTKAAIEIHDCNKDEETFRNILKKGSIIKIIIPMNKHHEFNLFLKNSGVSASRLFPDLFGLTLSLYEIDKTTI